VIIRTAVLVSAQIVVPHAQMVKITALIICFPFLRASAGAIIAGGTYTITFKEKLGRELESGASEALIDMIFNSITGVLPDWGAANRIVVIDACCELSFLIL
jgi:hypothetical protein